MKCEKHGVEMEWRGSLVAGRMHCDGCASVSMEYPAGATSGYSLNKDMVDAYLRSIQGKFDPGAPAGSHSVARTGLLPARGMNDQEIGYRIKSAEIMVDRHSQGHDAYCPYCQVATSPDHTQAMGSHQSQCYKAYDEDCKYQAMNRP